MPGVKQPCPMVAACWSPAMPRMRIGAAEQLRLGDAEIAGAVAHLRQQRRAARRTARTARRPMRRVPMSNSSVRAALVASVACTLPPVSRQSRKLSMVPKASSPGLRRRARAVDVVEQPGDLGGGEIRIEQQPGLGGDLRLRGRRARSARTGVGGAAVLPDDGVVDRLAGRAVPDDRGLALVGDADAGDVAGARAPALRHRLAHGRDRRRPDFLRIVLDPARAPDRSARSSCCATGERRQRRIEHDGARRGRALIDGDECGRQASPRHGARASAAAETSSTSTRFGDCLVGVGVDRGAPACAAPGRNNRRV